MIWLRDDLRSAFDGLAFDDYLRLGEHVVRVGPDGARSTAWFERAGRRYYVKAHTGVGWGEILKSGLQLKRPIVDARTEARALRRLEALGIPSARLVAFGVQGLNPARRRSFVVTESLEGTEDLAQWLAGKRELAPALRHALARALGEIAGRLHAARLAHQDLYLTHFRIRPGAGERFELFLIDLHRMLPAPAHARRWRLKDLAALRFSTLALSVRRSDCARFLRAYRGRPLLRGERAGARAFLHRIEARAHAVDARLRARKVRSQAPFFTQAP